MLDAVAKVGAGFRSLADAWANTTTPHGRLMLTVLGGLAEFERELSKARTGDGRAGRRPRAFTWAARQSRRRTSAVRPLHGAIAGELLTDIARTYGVSHTDRPADVGAVVLRGVSL